MVDVDVDSDDEVEMGPLPMMGPCGKDQVYRGGSCQDKLKVDPACDAEWQRISGGQPWLAKQYKGYAVGSAPCSSREMVPVDEVKPAPTDEDELENYKNVAGFDLFFGRRRPYSAGARPKKSQKHVGEIVVKGRRHLVFKGKEGGLYYMKGKMEPKFILTKD